MNFAVPVGDRAKIKENKNTKIFQKAEKAVEHESDSNTCVKLTLVIIFPNDKSLSIYAVSHSQVLVFVQLSTNLECDTGPISIWKPGTNQSSNVQWVQIYLSLISISLKRDTSGTRQ